MSSKKIGSIFLLPLLLILLLGILIFSMPETVQSTVAEQSTMPNTHTTILTTAVPIDLPTLVVGSAIIDVDTGDRHGDTIRLYGIPASQPLNALDLKISYDESMMSPTSCRAGPDGELDITDCDLTTPGSILIKAISIQGIVGGLDLASVTWDVFGPSGESTSITVDELTMLDTNNTEISYIVQNQTIHITGGFTGTDPVMVVGNRNGSSMDTILGQRFKTPIVLQNVQDIVGSVLLEIRYDESLLRPTNCTGGSPDPFVLTQCNLEYSPNAIRSNNVSLYGLSGSFGVNEIEWEVIGMPLNSTSIELEIIELRDIYDNLINGYATQNQTINIRPGVNTVLGSLDDAEPEVGLGQEFVLPITLDNTLELRDVSLTLYYNESRMEFTGCEVDPNSLFDISECKEDALGVIQISGEALNRHATEITMAQVGWKAIGPVSRSNLILGVEFTDVNGRLIRHGARDWPISIVEKGPAFMLGNPDDVPINVFPGQTFITPVRADTQNSSLYRATLGVTYDSSQLRPIGCTAPIDSRFETARCDLEFDAETVRVSTTSRNGVSGNLEIVNIRWQFIGPPGNTSLALENLGEPSNYRLKSQEIQAISGPTLSVGDIVEPVIEKAADATFELPVRIYDMPTAIGAIDLSISYDTSLIEARDCVLMSGMGTCMIDAASGVIRLSGVNRGGIFDDVALASITWHLFDSAVDETTINIEVETLVDSSLGEPIEDYVIQDQIIRIDTDVTPIFDLALSKRSNNKIARDEENVLFEIRVCNQGNIPASEILIVDYLPDALTLSDDGWTQVGDQAELTITGPLAPDTCTSVEIELLANHSSTSHIPDIVLNRAEIVRAIDSTGDVRTHDIDSTYDRLLYNDAKSSSGPFILYEDDYSTATVQIVNPNNHCYYYDALNCDGVFTAVDALFILRKDVGIPPLPIEAPGRPDPTAQDRLDEWCNFVGAFPHNDSDVAGDIDGNGICDDSDYEDYVYDVNGDYECNSVDALFILQCEVGLSNSFCPR